MSSVSLSSAKENRRHIERERRSMKGTSFDRCDESGELRTGGMNAIDAFEVV